MTLEELRELVASTTAADWSELTPGPVFIYGWGEGKEEDGEWRLFLNAHHSRAVLSRDLDVGIAWGLDCNEDFSEAWTRNFSNPNATSHHADILLRGVPVSREQYVSADGGRYKLPMPREHYEEIDASNYALMPYTISPWQYAFGRIIHDLSAGHDYDDGLSRARISVEP